jgi:hypothetical protein
VATDDVDDATTEDEATVDDVEDATTEDEATVDEE